MSAFLGCVCQGCLFKRLRGFLVYGSHTELNSDVFVTGGIYMALVYTGLTPYLVAEHLSCALRSGLKYELCTAKRVHSVNCSCSGSFICQNCLLMHCKAQGINSNTYSYSFRYFVSK